MSRLNYSFKARFVVVGIFIAVVAAELYYVSGAERDTTTLIILAAILFVGQIIAMLPWVFDAKNQAREIGSYDEKFQKVFLNQQTIHKEVNRLAEKNYILINRMDILQQKDHIMLEKISDAQEELAQDLESQKENKDWNQIVKEIYELLEQEVAVISEKIEIAQNNEKLSAKLDKIYKKQELLVEMFDSINEDKQESLSISKEPEFLPVEKEDNVSHNEPIVEDELVVSDSKEEDNVSQKSDPGVIDESLEKETPEEDDSSVDAIIQELFSEDEEDEDILKTASSKKNNLEKKIIKDNSQQELFNIESLNTLSKTQLVLNADLGEGNIPYLRGSKGGLSEDYGTPMVLIGENKWSFEFSGSQEEFYVDLYKNDTEESLGDSVRIIPNEFTELDYYPSKF